MTLEVYLLYLATVAVFFASPPDTSQLLIISNSMRHGLRKSAYTIAGDLSANSLQIVAASTGLAAVVTTSASAFEWIKWMGVGYLVWIGLKLILWKHDTERAELTSIANASPFRLYRQGFITSMANPYAVVFFGALFPQFIDPGANVIPQMLILGLTYTLIDGAILLGWGWAGTKAVKIQTLSGVWVNRVCGGLMIAAAALLAGKDFQPQRQ